MKLKAKLWAIYRAIYQFVAKNRLKQNDIDPREIHAQIAVVLTTGILMWSYVFLAFHNIASPIPAIVGIVSSMIHLLSPLLFRFTNNSYIPSNVLLGAGIVHQATFSYFSGGFDSNILIWFGILPLIGGVISGRKGAITWFVMTILVSLGFFVLHLLGHKFPNQITYEGRIWAQGFLVFGWIFLSSAIVIVYSGLRENSEKLLKEQGKKIDDLFRVLFHDLANPLGRIAIGLSIAKRNLPDGETNRGLEIAQNASDSMMEVTQSIRRMYAMSKGKGNVDLSLIPLNVAVDYVKKIYQPELDRRNITIEYHFDKHEGLKLLVEPVSFNNQVLGNIISNAIKFSPEHSQIFITAYPTNQGTFAIEIKDNGIGIPEQIKKQLFDINKKTSRPGLRGETGSGFGMHIMKSFVEMYGGHIHVESMETSNNLPSGTTVKIILEGEWLKLG